MPDPLTLLLDAIWIEAHWQVHLLRRNLRRVGWHLPVIADSLSGRNLFWVTVIEGR